MSDAIDTGLVMSVPLCMPLTLSVSHTGHITPLQQSNNTVPVCAALSTGTVVERANSRSVHPRDGVEFMELSVPFSELVGSAMGSLSSAMGSVVLLDLANVVALLDNAVLRLRFVTMVSVAFRTPSKDVVHDVDNVKAIKQCNPWAENVFRVK
ncbi:hypothetical protein GUJ93_ZPchr0007g3501 [Zizania palustris]|uniref:Uncharacterized protein n=1 Tax=Zizania palustris TaxID=103762 RepID=A0A8J5TF52_ZIZPA|nr:hypothetical protein GUJ93_ZPchr0007g3501 [Zizania palustris]